MKRTLFQNVKVLPYTAEEAIDRKGFLSVIFSVQASTAPEDGTIMEIEITHSDTEDGTFEPLKDELAELEAKALESIPIAAKETVNVDIDVIGCKQYVKFKPVYKKADGSAATVSAAYAIALGDASAVPV